MKITELQRTIVEIEIFQHPGEEIQFPNEGEALCCRYDIIFKSYKVRRKIGKENTGINGIY